MVLEGAPLKPLKRLIVHLPCCGYSRIQYVGAHTLQSRALIIGIPTKRTANVLKQPYASNFLVRVVCKEQPSESR